MNAVYTAIIGGKDDLKVPKVIDAGLDYICFTDTPLPFKDKRYPWDVRHITPSHDPVRMARRIKIMTHEYVEGYERSLWVDGKVRIMGSVIPLFEKYDGQRFMAWQHWQRNCVYTEARVCKAMGKDTPSIIDAQIKRYTKSRYPADNGLIRSEVLFRNHNLDAVKKLGEAWWEEVRTSSRRDQLSFPFVAYRQEFVYLRNQSQREFKKYFTVYKHVR